MSLSSNLAAMAAAAASSNPVLVAAPPAAARLPTGWGVARVFVSSTFRDFDGERSALVKDVFPAVKAWAERELRVQVVEVDLRWGIPEEDAALAAQLCLDEVAACQPLCIAMLGDRYGWCPGPDGLNLPPDPLYDFARAMHGDHSITALEIFAASLVRAVHLRECDSNTVCLLRSFDVDAHVPAELRDPVSRVCRDDNPDHREKLAALKGALREHLCPDNVLEYDATFGEFANGRVTVGGLDAVMAQTKARLQQILDNRFRATVPPPAADQWEDEVRLQRASARALAARVVGRDRELAEIQAYLDAPSAGQVLVLEAASGTGKSALMARAFTAQDEAAPAIVLCATSQLSSEARSCGGTLIRSISASAPVPTNLDDVGALLGALGGTVFVDGLNQLSELDALRWLPARVADSAHLVISVINDTPAAGEIRKRYGDRMRVVALEPLSAEASESVVTAALRDYGKRLSDSQLAALLSKGDARLPVFLKCAVEEIRVFPHFEGVDSFINILPEATQDLFGHVLERVEGECDADSVRRVLAAVRASRHGLPEGEITAVADCTVAAWSAVRSRLNAFLQQSHRVVLFHQHLAMAVEARYGERSIVEARRRIAAFLGASGDLARRTEEQPWQLSQIGDLAGLAAVLGDPEVAATFADDPNLLVEALHHVRALLASPSGADLVSSASARAPRAWTLLLREAGFAKRAVEISSGALDGGSPDLRVEHALALQACARYREAASVLEEVRDADAATGKDKRAVLVGLGGVYLDLGWHDKAEPLLQAAADGEADKGSLEYAEALMRLSQVHRARAGYVRARELLAEAQRLQERRLGKRHPLVAGTMEDLALLSRMTGEYDLAEDLYTEALEILRDALGPKHELVARCLHGRGMMAKMRGNVQQGIELLEEALALREAALGDHPATAVTLDALAQAYQVVDRIEEAEGLFRRAIAIKEAALGADHYDVGISYCNLAGLLRQQKRLDEAETLFNRDLDLTVRALGPEHPYVATSHNNLGALKRVQRQNDKALEHLSTCLTIREKALGTHSDTGIALANLGFHLVTTLDKTDPEAVRGMDLIDRGVAMLQETLGDDHPKTISAVRTRGILRNQQ